MTRLSRCLANRNSIDKSQSQLDLRACTIGHISDPERCQVRLDGCLSVKSMVC